MKIAQKVFKKAENRPIIQCSDSTPGYMSRKNKNTNSIRYMHPNVHSSTVYSSQDMAAIQVSINRRVAYKNVVISYIHVYTIYIYICIWAPQVALVVNNPAPNADDIRDVELNPWVGKSPWSRKWQPTPVDTEPGRL